MFIITFAVIVGLFGGKSKFRWAILTVFSVGVLLAVVTGFIPWYSLIAVPLSVVVSEVVRWAKNPHRTSECE